MKIELQVVRLNWVHIIPREPPSDEQNSIPAAGDVSQIGGIFYAQRKAQKRRIFLRPDEELQNKPA